jgi:DNA-binding LacI/PurR family transcriptional regulator
VFNKALQPEEAGVSAPTPNKRASIKDIARIANVSHSTVSRALRSSTLVNFETAEKIRRIAAENGFRASAVARSLATSRTHTIGVVVTSIADPFVAEVVAGIEEEANANNYSVFLANCNADPERELKVVQSFEDRRVDGIVVTASRVGALYARVLESLQIPIVLLNNQHPSRFGHSVMIENFDASRQAVAHLIGLGHRRIAYIGDRFGYGSDSERFSGYRSALDEADIPIDPDLFVHGDGKADSGMIAAEKLLATVPPPTAIFCYNDMTALGALKAIRTRGLSVPDDISLIGFDDLPLALYMDPPLTTVRQPKHEMGQLAMQVLLKLVSGSHSQQNIKVNGELILRQSTAAPKENTACSYSSGQRKAVKRIRKDSNSSRSATKR